MFLAYLLDDLAHLLLREIAEQCDDIIEELSLHGLMLGVDPVCGERRQSLEGALLDPQDLSLIGQDVAEHLELGDVQVHLSLLVRGRLLTGSV